MVKSNASTPLVLESTEERVRYISINRPEFKNALNGQVIAALSSAFKTASQDDSISCVVISGTGEEAFCSGADLSEIAALQSDEERETFFLAIASLIEIMGKCPKPVIAKVHGYALAGGFGIAAASDMIVASDEAVLGLPEVLVGMVPMIVLAPLSRTLSQKVLADLVLTGERISAKRAFEIQLVSRIFPKAQLDEKTRSLATSMAKLSSTTLKAAKEALYSVGDQEYFSSLPRLGRSIAQIAASKDTKEGIEAFRQKRKPIWNNQ